jgi:ubiquitin carboxyl-terminal hydrolase 16/45
MLDSADSTKVQRISQRKDVQSPLLIQEGKSVDSLTADSVSIQDLLLLFSEDHQVAWRCPNCTIDHEESSASQSKNGEQTVGSGNEDKTVVRDQIEQSDRTACHGKESECHGGILPAEKQTDLLGTVKQSEQARTAYLLKDSKNVETDDVGDSSMIYRFTMLPPVLTLHLKRSRHDTVGSKISGHVRFMEYLDVEQFMDPRYR